MSFLEGELDGGGDGFLDGVDDDEGSFLDGIEEQEQVSKPPHPHSCPNKKLIEEYWDDEWHDVTDTVESISGGMKTATCGGCGHRYCITKRNRAFECWKCGSISVDFGWEDDRIDTSDRPDWDRSKI